MTHPATPELLELLDTPILTYHTNSDGTIDINAAVDDPRFSSGEHLILQLAAEIEVNGAPTPHTYNEAALNTTYPVNTILTKHKLA